MNLTKIHTGCTLLVTLGIVTELFGGCFWGNDGRMITWKDSVHSVLSSLINIPYLCSVCRWYHMVYVYWLTMCIYVYKAMHKMYNMHVIHRSVQIKLMKHFNSIHCWPRARNIFTLDMNKTVLCCWFIFYLFYEWFNQNMQNSALQLVPTLPSPNMGWNTPDIFFLREFINGHIDI